MWRINQSNELVHIDGPDSVVWVPSQKLVFHSVDLPQGNKHAWQQMVSFALEDKLLGSIERMHFVISQKMEEEGAVVVSVPMELMTQWVDLLKQNKVRTNQVSPDFMAIPWDAQTAQAVLWCESGTCLLRTGEQQNFEGSIEWLHSIAQVYSKDLKIFSDGSVSLPAEWEAPAEPLPASLETLMQEATQQKQPINFLQGAFKSSSPALEFFRPWYWSGIAVILLLSLYLGELQIKAQTLQAQTANIHKASELTLEAYFHDKAVKGQNVRSYLSKVMSALQDGMVARQQSTWKIMLSLDAIIRSCPPCRVEKIKLTAEQLKLEISSSKDMGPWVKKVQNLPKVAFKSEPLKAGKERNKARWTLIFKGGET